MFMYIFWILVTHTKRDILEFKGQEVRHRNVEKALCHLELVRRLSNFFEKERERNEN